MPELGDLAGPLCDALVAVLKTDPAIVTFMGTREVPYVVPFDDINAVEDEQRQTDFPLPIYVYDYVDDVEIGGVRDQREAQLTLDAIAEGNDALARVTAMLALARKALTWTAFQVVAPDLDAFVKSPIRQQGSTGDADQTRGLVIHRLLLTIRAVAPPA